MCENFYSEGPSGNSDAAFILRNCKYYIQVSSANYSPDGFDFLLLLLETALGLVTELTQLSGQPHRALLLSLAALVSKYVIRHC